MNLDQASAGSACTARNRIGADGMIVSFGYLILLIAMHGRIGQTSVDHEPDSVIGK
jgi:hypothetical protein